MRRSAVVISEVKVVAGGSAGRGQYLRPKPRSLFEERERSVERLWKAVLVSEKEGRYDIMSLGGWMP